MEKCPNCRFGLLKRGVKSEFIYQPSTTQYFLITNIEVLACDMCYYTRTPREQRDILKAVEKDQATYVRMVTKRFIKVGIDDVVLIPEVL